MKSLRTKLPNVTALTLHFAVIETAWGACGVSWVAPAEPVQDHGFALSPRGTELLGRILTPGLNLPQLRMELRQLGVKMLASAGTPDVREILPDHRGRFSPEVVPVWFAELADFLQGYFDPAFRPSERAWSAALWPTWRPRLFVDQLTLFQLRVLETTAAIPCGSVLTYAEVARRIGRPGGARAVGAALGANPWPVLVPCHRVVGAGGALTGFSAPGGVSTKARMLAQEGAGAPENTSSAGRAITRAAPATGTLPGLPADIHSTAAPFCR